MRSMIGPVPSPARVAKSGPARYTALLVGLGATGVAIGWLGPRLAASASSTASQAGLIRRH